MATLKLNDQTVVTESGGALTAPALNVTTGTFSGTLAGTLASSARASITLDSSASADNVVDLLRITISASVPTFRVASSASIGAVTHAGIPPTTCKKAEVLPIAKLVFTVLLEE